MKRAKILVLEGCDACGKSTQIELIKEFYKSKNLKLKHIHFPMYGHNEASAIISAYLRGEYGDINTVNPKFVGMIFAMDRYFYLPTLEQDLQENDILLMDRYVFSGMAFQGAKYKTKEETLEIMNWLYDYEFKTLGLPMYDLCLFIDVSIDTIKERLAIRASKENRDYLNGKADIHEADIEFQKRVKTNYEIIFDGSNDYMKNSNATVVCENLPPEEIFKLYEYLLK